MRRDTTCCFTGHRPERLPWGGDESDPRCEKLKAALARTLEDAYHAGYRHFICGMACGADFYFCEAALALRDRRSGVTVEAAIPCLSQPDRWRPEDRERYARLVGYCDFETVVQQDYDRGCMLRRNRYMVERSERLIAVYDGTPTGGTSYTLQYAMKRGLELVLLPPDGREEHIAARP